MCMLLTYTCRHLSICKTALWGLSAKFMPNAWPAFMCVYLYQHAWCGTNWHTWLCVWSDVSICWHTFVADSRRNCHQRHIKALVIANVLFFLSKTSQMCCFFRRKPSQMCCFFRSKSNKDSQAYRICRKRACGSPIWTWRPLCNVKAKIYTRCLQRLPLSRTWGWLCVYVCVCMCVCVYVNEPTSICACFYVCIWCICMRMSSATITVTTHTYTYTCTHINTWIMHACIHTYIQYIHTYTWAGMTRLTIAPWHRLTTSSAAIFVVIMSRLSAAKRDKHPFPPVWPSYMLSTCPDPRARERVSKRICSAELCPPSPRTLCSESSRRCLCFLSAFICCRPSDPVLVRGPCVVLCLPAECPRASSRWAAVFVAWRGCEWNVNGQRNKRMWYIYIYIYIYTYIHT
jgi:hypothetical protein